MPRLMLLAILCTLLLPLNPTAAQDDPRAPYLFYFSRSDHAFVIERADGTDSRLLGAELMPPDANAVYGPGWSPSGTWFAWQSMTRHGEGMDSPSTPHAISVDGTRRVTALDAFPHSWLAWSPTTDLLLVASQSYTPTVNCTSGERTLTLRVAVIDPAADTVVMAWNHAVPVTMYHLDAFPYPEFTATWSTDAQHIIVRHGAKLVHWAEPREPLIFHVIGLDDTATIYQHAWTRLLGQGPDVDHVVYTEGNTLIIENLITDTREQFTDAPANITRFAWATGDDAALLWSNPCQQIPRPAETPEQCVELWLFERSTKQFTLLYAGNEDDDPIYTPESYWSPDGTRAIFLTDDTSFMLLDRATQSVTPLLTFPPDTERWQLGNMRWNGWYWRDNDHVVLPGPATGDGMQEVHFFDLSTSRHVVYHTATYSYRTMPRPSPDGRYAAHVGLYPAVVETATGIVHKLPPDSRGYHSAAGGEIIWHPSSNWMIIRDDALIAGGAHVRWTSVATHRITTPRISGQLGQHHLH